MTGIYPKITIQLPKNPNRLYAVPILGLLLKLIMLLPVGIEIFFVGLALFLYFAINSLYVLFTGRYWENAYSLTMGFSNLFIRGILFLDGITDNYPGFSLKSGKLVSIDRPNKPNKLFAFPFLGGMVRFLLLIPYYIYGSIISRSAWVGTLYAVKPVLFKEKYPEITYEIVLDSTRINLAPLLYFGGLSDKYPSFKISMNHKTEKIILLILGTILFLISNDFKSGFK